MTSRGKMYKQLFIWGAGIRGEEAPSLQCAEENDIPIVLTWGAIDLLPHDHRLNIGCFGTHGMKAANLAIQNAHDIVSFGCRLDTKATGTPKDFAPHADILMIDIDQKEIDKMEKLGRPVEGMNQRCGDLTEWNILAKSTEWLKQCQAWKAEFVPKGPVYDLMNKIGEYTTPEDIIVSDTGNTLGWIMQGFPFKGERFIHAFNYTPMGYGLGAAIGAAFASDRRVIAIVGDGGALMSIQELATIARHKLNIKIILLDNAGHSMCRHTQRQWLGSNYYATSIEGGLGMPEWWSTFYAFNIFRFNEIEHLLDPEMEPLPGCYIAKVDPDESLYFQVRYGEKLA